MTTIRGRSEISQEALGRAADWFVDFRVGDADATTREQFDIWLRQAPQNVQAYLEIARTYAEIPAINPSGKVDAEALIAYARTDANVVTLPNVSAATSPSSASRNRLGLALAASLLLGVAGAITWSQLRGDTYSTDIGEQRFITLSDGSTIDLNARTRIRVKMTGDTRLVQLLEGQALFKVAKDKTRPFIVRSDDTQVRAVGTQFDVYRRKSGTTVTVLEGRVAVVPVGSNTAPTVQHPEPPMLLAAGEQTTIAPERAPAKVPANISAAVAWTDQLLVFDATPLPQVAEEFNRYTRRQLIVHDAARLDTFHISGVYSSTDPASLVRFLRVQPGIDVIETDSEIRISPK